MGGVYELKWENGRYERADKQRLAKWMNVYGFTYGDIFKNGRESVLAIRNNGKLSILNNGDNEEWTSDETYGGSDIYLLSPADKKAATSVGRQVDPTAFKGRYLEQRIFITDLDDDKTNEVIVVKNRDAARGLVQRYRNYSGGHFEALVWDTVGLRPKWKTRKFSGYLSDSYVGDLNNDGLDDLVFAVIAKTGIAFREPKSYIVSWSLKK